MSYNPTQFGTLQKRLTKLGFNEWELVLEKDVKNGALFPFTRFIRFMLQEAFPDVTRTVFAKHSWFVIEDNAVALCETFLKILKLEFSYKASVTSAQFVKEHQFAGAKVATMIDSLTLFSRRQQEIQKRLHSASTSAAQSRNASRSVSILHSGASPNRVNVSGGSGIVHPMGVVDPNVNSSAMYGPCHDTSRCSHGTQHSNRFTQAVEEQQAKLFKEIRLLDLRHRALNRVVRVPHTQEELDVSTSIGEERQ